MLVERNKWFGELTLNTIFWVVVGKRFSTGFEGSNDGGCEGEQFLEAVLDFLELFGAFCSVGLVSGFEFVELWRV